MRYIAPALALLLLGCTATLTSQPETMETTEEYAFVRPPEFPLEVSEKGSAFFGKFATSAALNAKRSFVSEYHGEMRIHIHRNRKVECRFFADGRVTDPTIHEGANGFIKAFSTLCSGKLQRDGSFEFQGAYTAEGLSDIRDEDATFTLRGTATSDTVRGELLLGGLFRRSEELMDTVQNSPSGGVRFEVARTAKEE